MWRRRDTAGVLVAGIVFLHVSVAVIFLCGGHLRFSAPPYDVARATMPIHAWALVFAVIALVVSVATYANRFRLLLAGTALGSGLCVWWAVIFLRAAHDDPRSGLLGIVLWLTVAVLHVATAVAAGWRLPLRST